MRRHLFPAVVAIAAVAGILVGQDATARTAETSAEPHVSALIPAQNTSLDWLGPLPRKLTPGLIKERAAAMMAAIEQDMKTASDLRNIEFTCRPPSKFGPLPEQTAVDAYLSNLPDIDREIKLRGPFMRAAARGNWLARAEMLFLLSLNDFESYESQFRALQLVEWLHTRKAGVVIAWYAHVKGESSPQDRPNLYDWFAALRQHYPSQIKLGRNMIGEVDPQRKATGKRMLECASLASPAYAKLIRAEQKFGLEPVMNSDVVDADILKTALDVGNDPFTPLGFSKIYSTAFAGTFRDFESGRNRQPLEFLLSTGKLAPRSELATAYLSYAAGWMPAVTERLLSYGALPSLATLDALIRNSNDTPEDLNRNLVGMAKLLERYPYLQSRLRDLDAKKLLSSALKKCRAGFASYLAERGITILQGDQEGGFHLIARLTLNCEPGVIDADDRTQKYKLKDAQSFVRALAKRGFDFNARDDENCPAWLGGQRFSCVLPGDDGLVIAFLEAGADPYLTYGPEQETGITAAVHGCRLQVLDRMLTSLPSRKDGLTRDGLERAIRNWTKAPGCSADKLEKRVARIRSRLKELELSL